ncbi:unnamed protein product [Urochloa humidicola]
MAPLRHAAATFQGPFRLDWWLHLQRRGAHPPHFPSPAPSPPPPPLPPPSPPPAAAEATPNPAPSLATPISSSGTARNASPLLGPPRSSSGSPPTASLPVTSPRATNKRKADDSLLPETESDGDRKKMRSGETFSSSSLAEAVVWKMVTLEEIRALPQSATRPFYPRTLRRGVRSIKEPQPWKCSECGNVNHLTRHLLFDLPAFKCKGCNAEPRKGEADFGFCYSDLALNEACPIGHVKSQKPGQCIPNTISSCVEITHRVMATILEQPISREGPFIDIDDLLGKYEKRWLKEGRKKINVYTGQSLLTMIDVFRFDGVKEKKSIGSEKNSSGLQKLHRISDWAWVDQKDFAAMSSAVADGYPLIVLYETGPRLRNLKPGDVYVPPLHGAIGGHASLLVGAHQEGAVKSLYFLSSNSEMFCQRSQNKGDGIRGGIGAIVPGRFDFDPIQILRFNEWEGQAVQQQ